MQNKAASVPRYYIRVYYDCCNELLILYRNKVVPVSNIQTNHLDRVQYKVYGSRYYYYIYPLVLTIIHSYRLT